MKISEQWLRELVDPPIDSERLAEQLTLAGLEVDGMEPAGPALEGLIVAEVRAVEQHPDADRLRVCQVFDGEQEHTVVCGAPNVHAGMKAVLAPPGSRLPDGTKIKVSKLRGIKSSGMLCSATELGLGDDASGLLELATASEAGAAVHSVLALNDTILDIGLTPNRGDCFCALGIARDIAVLNGLPFNQPDVHAVMPVHQAEFQAELKQPAACARYAGRVIEGLNPAATTPLWMRERLRRCGVRCIHPLVDVTNYVMLEFGQPMHAFDRDRLNGGIVVRNATPGESLVLLDGQTVELDETTLVIADHSQAVALAGVMGGDNTAVSAQTSRVFLESAFFDPIKLAGVARRFRLHTDASLRFERGVDPYRQERAIERATALIIEICGGQAGPVTVAESAAHMPAQPVIEFSPQAVNRLLGTAIDDERSLEIIRALGMSVSAAAGAAGWQVSPPSFRSDIRIEADLVEEVARIHGYDNIPVRLPQAAAGPALPIAEATLEQALRDDLISRGYFEAITYSFIASDDARRFYPDAEQVNLANPIASDMSQMRPGLWPGLLAAAQHNLNRQIDDVRLFELGQVFADASGQFAQMQHIGGLRVGRAHAQHWDSAARDVDFFDVKQDIEVMFKNISQRPLRFTAAEHPALHPGQSARVEAGELISGWLGALHPAIARHYDIDKPLFLFEFDLSKLDTMAAPQFTPISRFPAVRRDLSVVLDEGVSAEACMAAAREGAGAILHDLQLFDVYRGQGIDSDKKSLTLGLIFQDVSSTLTDEEVEAAVARALNCVTQRVGGTLRD